MTAFNIRLVHGLLIVGVASEIAAGQVTLPACTTASCYVFSESQGTGYGFSGYILPTLNAPFAAIGDGISSTATADYSFTTSSKNALLRIDLDHARSSALNHFASSAASVGFTLSSPMPYELTGQYAYAGNESAHFGVSLYSTGCIYCGEQNMNSPGTATVGTLTGGVLPGGPTSGMLPAGTYTLILESFIFANLGQGPADANGFVQLQLGNFSCPADIEGDNNIIDVFDLLELLDNWGTAGNGAAIAEPTNIVDVFDLLALLESWGACK